MENRSKDALQSDTEDTPSRRGFIGASAFTVMAGGMTCGYGMLAVQSGQYLYPANAGEMVWQFVCTLDQLAVGESRPFTFPSGVKVVVARQTEGDTASAFIALSSICPHLGCQVHWEAAKTRFFCPCHNGAFDASGKATEGPPAKANQELTQFPLEVANNLLLIAAPMDFISAPEAKE